MTANKFTDAKYEKMVKEMEKEYEKRRQEELDIVEQEYLKRALPLARHIIARAEHYRLDLLEY